MSPKRTVGLFFDPTGVFNSSTFGASFWGVIVGARTSAEAKCEVLISPHLGVFCSCLCGDCLQCILGSPKSLSRGSADRDSCTSGAPIRQNTSSSPADSVGEVPGNTGVTELAICSFCPKRFKLGRAMSQHLRLGHPVQYNQEKAQAQPSQRRSRMWSPEDDHALAREAVAVHVGLRERGLGGIEGEGKISSRDLAKAILRRNAHGDGLFPGRSEEALRKRVETASRYQELVAELLCELEARPERSNPGDEERIRSDPGLSVQPEPVEESDSRQESPPTTHLGPPEGQGGMTDLFVSVESLGPDYEADYDPPVGESLHTTHVETVSGLGTSGVGGDSGPGSQTGAQEPPPPGPYSALLESLRPEEGSQDTIDLTGLEPGVACPQNRSIVESQYSIFTQVCPTKALTVKRGVPKPITRQSGLSRRKLRRKRYFELQRAWSKNPAQTAKKVLDGTWGSEQAPIPMETMQAFWKPIFEAPSKPDNRTVEPIRSAREDCMVPVSLAEVESALKGSKTDAAAGPDGRNLADLKKAPAKQLLARMFNLWLTTACIPMELTESRTVLIPKEMGTRDPAKHRPITVSSVLIRVFHKILAARLDTHCPPSDRQKAFRSGDGLFENVAILKSVLHSARGGDIMDQGSGKTKRGKTKPVALIFLDVRKAFDSVSHQSLLLAARRAGVPEGLLAYIQTVYRTSTLKIHAGGEVSENIRPAQGVKQGDPLSCFLFNSCIDWAISELDQLGSQGIGFDMGTYLLNHLAFADDLCLLAASPQGLRVLVKSVETKLAAMGLYLNAGKCATMQVIKDGKNGKTHIGSQSIVSLSSTEGNIPVTALGIGDTYKYLGITFKPKGTYAAVKDKVIKKIAAVNSVPLKPQQRLHILKTNIVPAVWHELVMAEVFATDLRQLDRVVRAAVRGWLHLPKDTPIPFYHADLRDGGLGIPCIEQKSQSLRLSRLLRLMASSDPAVQAAWSQGIIPAEIQRYSKRLCPSSDTIGLRDLDKHLQSANTARELHDNRVDTAGLRCASNATLGTWRRPVGHRWLSCPAADKIQGSMFCQMVALRAGVLETGVRRDRRLPPPDQWNVATMGQRPSPRCEACAPALQPSQAHHVEGNMYLDTLNHRLQKCAKTHGYTVYRHNRLVKVLEGFLTRRGAVVKHEPGASGEIRDPGGRQWKPDMFVTMPEGTGGSLVKEVWCIDPTVTTDGHQNMDTPHFEKVNYYSSVPCVEEAMKSHSGAELVRFSALAINWRGIIAPTSLRDMNSLGLSKTQIEILCQIVVEQGVRIYRAWSKTTHRRGISFEGRA